MCNTTLSSSRYSLPEVAQIVGDDGSFSWRVPGPGTFVVNVLCSGDLSGKATVEVDDADVEIEVPLS